jgi:hypothetical protein
MERRAERSLVVEQQAVDIQERVRYAAEIGRLEREAAGLQASILDLSASISDAKRFRDKQMKSPIHDMDARREQARDKWLALRQGQGSEHEQPKPAIEHTQGLIIDPNQEPQRDRVPDHGIELLGD